MAIRFGPSPALPAFCYLAGIGVPLAVIDARCQRLPDALTLPSYPVALALLGFAALLLPGGAGHFLGALAGLALACGVFLLQVLLYPAGLGWGDVKLSGLLGLYLGWLGGGWPGGAWWGLLAGSGRPGRRPVPRVPVRRGRRARAHRRPARVPEVASAVRPLPAGRDAHRHPAQFPDYGQRPVTRPADRVRGAPNSWRPAGHPG